MFYGENFYFCLSFWNLNALFLVLCWEFDLCHPLLIYHSISEPIHSYQLFTSIFSKSELVIFCFSRKIWSTSPFHESYTLFQNQFLPISLLNLTFEVWNHFYLCHLSINSLLYLKKILSYLFLISNFWRDCPLIFCSMLQIFYHPDTFSIYLSLYFKTISFPSLP